MKFKQKLEIHDNYSLGPAKVNGFPTLREKFMICGPKSKPPKSQPLIRSKTAGIKTRIEREHSVNHIHCTTEH
jgi:hypothetical protein